VVALDVSSGDVVWRLRDRLPFSHAISLDHEAAFTLSGSGSGNWKLHHLDPWTGAVRFSAPLDDDQPAPNQAPLVTPDAVVVPVLDQAGVGARAFCRTTGKVLWDQPTGLASPTTAWLAVDDAIVANSDAGVLLCLDAKTGRVRYNHVFSRNTDADTPRRLEPVLRSGALFVPQQSVHVVRPRDGEVIGTLPSDLIPDLIRVDECCNVYVAEESGHLAAFGAAPRLTVVKS
jgi:outer membrane protein assembly factor BamB